VTCQVPANLDAGKMDAVKFAIEGGLTLFPHNQSILRTYSGERS
jgi:hypothetical protein